MEIADPQREVETISRVYARLHGIERTDDWLVLKLGEEVGELTRAYLAWSGRSRQEASGEAFDDQLRDEVADVLAHLLLVAERVGVDVDDALERKWFRWRHLIEDQDRVEGQARTEDRPGVTAREPAAGHGHSAGLGHSEGLGRSTEDGT